MVTSTIPSKTGRLVHRPDPLARASRRARKESAAAVRDTFLDVVVLLSVLMFLLLAAGVGVLALQATTSL